VQPTLERLVSNSRGNGAYCVSNCFSLFGLLRSPHRWLFLLCEVISRHSLISVSVVLRPPHTEPLPSVHQYFPCNFNTPTISLRPYQTPRTLSNLSASHPYLLHDKSALQRPLYLPPNTNTRICIRGLVAACILCVCVYVCMFPVRVHAVVTVTNLMALKHMKLADFHAL
jgi:hypothetical protein